MLHIEARLTTEAERVRPGWRPTSVPRELVVHYIDFEVPRLVLGLWSAVTVISCPV